MTGRGDGPEVIKAQGLALPLTCCSLGKAGSAPHLGSIEELTLDVRVVDEPAPSEKVGELSLPLSPLFWPLYWQLVRELASIAVIRAGELCLVLACCSTQESRP